VGFLLARPVSRRELFNTLVLARGVPLILLMFFPFLITRVLSPWLNQYLPLNRLAAGDLVAAVLVVAMYLLGAK